MTHSLTDSYSFYYNLIIILIVIFVQYFSIWSVILVNFVKLICERKFCRTHSTYLIRTNNVKFSNFCLRFLVFPQRHAFVPFNKYGFSGKIPCDIKRNLPHINVRWFRTGICILFAKILYTAFVRIHSRTNGGGWCSKLQHTRAWLQQLGRELGNLAQ